MCTLPPAKTLPCDGHGLVQGLASHFQDRELAKGDSRLLGGPHLIWGKRLRSVNLWLKKEVFYLLLTWGEGQPVVLIGGSCKGEYQPGSLSTSADVKVGELHGCVYVVGWVNCCYCFDGSLTTGRLCCAACYAVGRAPIGLVQVVLSKTAAGENQNFRLCKFPQKIKPEITEHKESWCIGRDFLI